MRVCPFRKLIVKECGANGQITVTTHFAACYERQCPFWNSYKNLRMKEDKN